MGNLGKLPGILIAVGLFVIVTSLLVGFVGFPAVIRSKISQQVRLEKDGDTYKKWENIPIPIYIKIYIFNVTNPQEIMKGENPVVDEVGPYVYQQKRVKEVIQINQENDTIEYKQRIFYSFRPDLSNGTESDVLSLVNLPLVGLAAKMLKMSNLERYAARGVLDPNEDGSTPEDPFIIRNVSQFLFGGYHVPFMQELAELKGEPLLLNDTFGLYYGKNGSDSGLTEVYSGVKDNTKFGNIAAWQGSSELPFWNDPYCNMINGSDGALFPPFVTQDRVLSIFSPELCRSLYLTFNRETEVHGLKGYSFTLPKELLTDPRKSEANKCFCTDPGNDMDNCPKTGAYQLESCRKGAPLVVSLPHFLDGDAEYSQNVSGLHAVRASHETFITLEPNTGVLLEAKKRIQINLAMRPVSFFKPLKKLPRVILPVFWADESAELTEESAERIKGKLLKPQKIVNAGCWGIFGVGIVLALIGVIVFIVRARRHGGEVKFGG